MGKPPKPMAINPESFKCVLLADRHHGLTEGVRGLLETVFDGVVMVADQTSLFETASRLRPTLAVVDLSLARGNNLRWLQELRTRCPALKIVALSVHDEPSVERAALEAGADAVVLKRAIARELLPIIEGLLAESVVAPSGSARQGDTGAHKPEPSAPARNGHHED